MLSISSVSAVFCCCSRSWHWYCYWYCYSYDEKYENFEYSEYSEYYEDFEDYEDYYMQIMKSMKRMKTIVHNTITVKSIIVTIIFMYVCIYIYIYTYHTMLLRKCLLMFLMKRLMDLLRKIQTHVHIYIIINISLRGGRLPKVLLGVFVTLWFVEDIFQIV